MHLAGGSRGPCGAADLCAVGRPRYAPSVPVPPPSPPPGTRLGKPTRLLRAPWAVSAAGRARATGPLRELSLLLQASDAGYGEIEPVAF